MTQQTPSIHDVFSVSPAEMVTIALVGLLVFGPQRLPEIARKLGRIGREVSRAAQELKAGIEREYDEAAQPMEELRRRLGATVEDSKADPAPEPTAESPAGPTAPDKANKANETDLTPETDETDETDE